MTIHQPSLQGIATVQNRRKTLIKPSLTANFFVVTWLKFSDMLFFKTIFLAFTGALAKSSDPVCIF
jgi:hypothetical protein